MNTHDIDIELPPLPSPFGIVDPDGTEGMMHYTIRDLQDYAKAYARTAIEADRKRRGEPVAWRWKWKDLPDAGWQLSSVGGWRETDAIKAEPLYLAPIAPQPALDAADLAFIADELRQAGKNRAADMVMQAMAYPTQPAEPVKVPSEIDIFELWSGDPTHSQPIADKGKVLAFARDLLAHYGQHAQPAAKFRRGDRVRKLKGSNWQGRVVGTYSTSLTPEGYAVESDTEHGSVQIYPAAALELVEGQPVEIAEQPADPDAERYRKFLGAGLPITYLGEDYRDKSSLDAAIDATGEP